MTAVLPPPPYDQLLFRARSARLRGRLFTPNTIRVWGDRVERHEPHVLLKSNTNSIPFTRAAQVSIRKGLVWSEVIVESSGGHLISITGLNKRRAAELKSLLDRVIPPAQVASR